MLTIRPKRLAVFVLGGMGIFFSFSHADRSQNLARDSTPIVVRIDKTPRGTAFRVNSKLVSPTATANLLYLLDRADNERGSTVPVVVLVDARVAIAEMSNVDGVAGKVPLTNIRYFLFNPESKFMTELKWGPTQPFSTNPN